MKIKIEYPFSEKWDKAYLVVNKEPRRNVILYNSLTKHKTTVSYARYLMSVHMRRFLEAWEVVDHKNENKLDDRISNFQILTKSENSIKSKVFHGLKITKIICPVCSKVFSRRTANTQVATYHHGRVSCCSRSCSFIFMSKNLSKEERLNISTNSILK